MQPPTTVYENITTGIPTNSIKPGIPQPTVKCKTVDDDYQTYSIPVVVSEETAIEGGKTSDTPGDNCKIVETTKTTPTSIKTFSITTTKTFSSNQSITQSCDESKERITRSSNNQSTSKRRRCLDNFYS